MFEKKKVEYLSSLFKNNRLFKKRTFYLFFIFVILFSCKSKNELEGIWIGAYQIHHSEKSSLSSLRLLLDISKDEIIFKSFDYPSIGEIDTSLKFKYSIIGRNLIFDSDTFLIKKLSKDSLVLSFQSGYKSEYVFKRMIGNKKNHEINLINKAFSFTGTNYADSIDFINDSLILYIGNEYNLNNRLTNWAIKRYKSFDFLVIDQFQWPPLLITYASENEILLKLYYTSINDFKMTKMEISKDTTGIMGDWIWPPNQNGIDFLLPPPPGYPDDVNTNLYLRINKDSIVIEQYGKIESKIWKLNSTNEYIYFPEDYMTNYGVWKIIKINKNELVIDRNIRQFSKDEREIINFEKMKKDE